MALPGSSRRASFSSSALAPASRCVWALVGCWAGLQSSRPKAFSERATGNEMNNRQNVRNLATLRVMNCGFGSFKAESGRLRSIIEGDRSNRNGCLAFMLGERHYTQNFQRPGWAEWSSDRIAILIREGIDEDDPLRRNDIAINKFAPHLAAVRRAHTVKENAARTEIQFFDTRLEILSPPPSLQALRLGVRLENEFAWSVEDTRDDELTTLDLRNRIIFQFGHVYSPHFVMRFLQIADNRSTEGTVCSNNRKCLDRIL